MTELLLDTHAFIWALHDPRRLGPIARAAMEDRDNRLYVSIVTAWEISLKRELRGKASAAMFEELLEMLEASLHPLALHHIATAADLARHHADPFDRLLIGTAISDRLTLVSCDRMFVAYPVPIIW